MNRVLFRPGLDIVVLIPTDRQRGTPRERVRRAVRYLWSRGIYPGPSAVSMRLRGYTQRCLNGRETSWRNAMMLELGITRQRHDPRFPLPPRSL